MGCISLLAVLLVMLGIIKLVTAHVLSKSEIQNISTILSTNPEEFKRGAINFLILDGLVGIFCGVYLLLL